MTSDPVLVEVLNPEGRLVQLASVTWNHVLEEHAEMAALLPLVVSTIATPEYREADPRIGRERYFRRGGPLRWVRVVVEFSGHSDLVVTAFPQDNDPRPRGAHP